jgi:hypothetical protein
MALCRFALHVARRLMLVSEVQGRPRPSSLFCSSVALALAINVVGEVLYMQTKEQKGTDLFIFSFSFV